MSENATATVTAARKTAPALNLSITWTPDAERARSMMTAAISEDCPLLAEGGRLVCTASFEIDPLNPVAVAAAAAEAQRWIDALTAAGRVHHTTSNYGRAPVENITKVAAS